MQYLDKWLGRRTLIFNINTGLNKRNTCIRFKTKKFTRIIKQYSKCDKILYLICKKWTKDQLLLLLCYQNCQTIPNLKNCFIVYCPLKAPPVSNPWRLNSFVPSCCNVTNVFEAVSVENLSEEKDAFDVSLAFPLKNAFTPNLPFCALKLNCNASKIL